MGTPQDTHPACCSCHSATIQLQGLGPSTHLLKMRAEPVNGSDVFLCDEEQEMPAGLITYMNDAEFRKQMTEINEAILKVASYATGMTQTMKYSMLWGIGSSVPTLGLSNLLFVPGLFGYLLYSNSRFRTLNTEFEQYIHGVHCDPLWVERRVRWHIGEFGKQIAVSTETDYSLAHFTKDAMPLEVHLNRDSGRTPTSFQNHLEFVEGHESKSQCAHEKDVSDVPL